MQKYSAVLLLLLGFAVVTTTLAGANVAAPGAIAEVNMVANSPHANTGPVYAGIVYTAKALWFLDGKSFTLAPASWLTLGALVVWRGRVRATWSKIGLEEPLFILFVRARGGKTRTDLLKCVSTASRNRYQISRDLNLAWRAVDRHVKIMTARGLLKEDAAYGRVRMYMITPLGKILLRTLNDLEGAS